MKAFHNDLKIKNKYLKRVAAHLKGHTGEDGKGCAMWCTLDKYDHKSYESELGIPEWLTRVEDCLFEGLPEKRSQTWPEEFLKAIKPGKDLSTVEAPFVIFILEGNLKNFDNEKYPDIVKVTKDIIELFKNGDLEENAAWNATWSAAYVKFADKLLELLKNL